MKRLFWEIYSVILLSIFAVLLLSYTAFSYLNQYRYQTHLQEVMSGTAYLLKAGVNRQEGENQQRWLTLSASLLNAGLSIRNLKKPFQNPDEKNAFIYKEELNSELFVLQQKLNKANKILEFKFEGFTEQIATATAFLLLNEIGRYDVSKRQSAFDDISQIFSYPIYRRSRQDLVLDSRQLERLDRGETIIEWDKHYGRGLSINVYAPWGSTSDLLHMGSIDFFEPYPFHIVVSVFIFALILIALSVFVIIKHLTGKLYQLHDKVDAISPNNTLEIEQSADTSALDLLTLKVHNMAERIKSLLDEKAYMIRAVSHDLRTPIAKMQFRLEMLLADLDEKHPALLGCNKDLDQLSTLIDELLTYEKLTLQLRINIYAIDIMELVTEQLQNYKLLYPKLTIAVISKLPKNFILEGNEPLLNRLLDNLVNNGARYADSKLTLTLIIEDKHLKLQIDDDGNGLDNKTISKLFSPFYRAEGSRNSKNGGYGLGLAIVKQVAMQHKASITACNNELGGARFTLLFPLKLTALIESEKSCL
ncbi:ATP-binding protein [Pseudoalteromonas sp. NBT06-2]|uniref:ATP-binding protein n=1 Tax=Pseudoalteromonas sp. NBT06-2 TaxID=2025950 RepID=UPI001483CF6A|nr:ATP-binding protein [Pseudoalteromonas sp. NBT06-2]